MNRTIARLCAALLGVGLLSVAAPALAHVSVSSTDAAPGGFGKVVFRVPTESEKASTTKVVVTLPKDTPLAFVNAGTKPGWKVEVTKEKLDRPTKVGDFTLTEAVRTVTWTSTDGGTPPEQFDEFALSGGPLPDAKEMVFTAEQTYSDGEVVDWDEVQKGDAEPEYPAPALALVSAPVDESRSTTSAAQPAAPDGGAAPWLAAVALVVAAVALVVAMRENRRRA